MAPFEALMLAMRVLAYWLWVFQTLFNVLAWVWELVIVILSLGGKPA